MTLWHDLPINIEAVCKPEVGSLFGRCSLCLQLCQALTYSVLNIMLHGADDKGNPEEYLPLPISEEYQLPSKSRRRSAQGQRTHSAQPRSSSRPDRNHWTAAHRAPPKEGGRLTDSMDRPASEQSLPGAEGLHPNAAEQGSDQAMSLQDAAAEGAAEQRPLGPVFPRKHKPAKPKRQGEQGGHRHQSSKAQLPVSAYDFAAARATAKGLDVSSIMGLPAKRKAAHNGASARGGRGSGRGERDAAGTIIMLHDLCLFVCWIRLMRDAVKLHMSGG